MSIHTIIKIILEVIELLLKSGIFSDAEKEAFNKLSSTIKDEHFDVLNV